MKYLRLIFFAFVVFCIGYALKGATYTVSGATMTLTENTTTNLVTVTYSFERRDDGGGDPDNYYTGGSVIVVPENGSNTNLGTAFNENSVHTGWGPSPWTVTGTSAFTRDPTKWYRVRVYKSNDANVITESNVVWIPPGPPTEIKYRVAGTNGTASVMRRYLVSGGTEVVGYVEALPGATYDHTFTVTSAQNAAGLTVVTYLQDEFKDGVWVQNNSFNTSTATLVKSEPVSGVTVPAGGIPDAPSSSYSPPGPTSAAPTSQTSISGVWSSGNYGKETTDSDRLDKSTYREGVDKLETELKGKASDVPTAPTTEGTPVFTAPANPNRLVSKLPSAPTIAAPSAPVTAVTVALEIPGINVQPITIDFDRPGFSAPVAVFRNIMLGVMGLIYLMLSIRTVRGAFAGK